MKGPDMCSRPRAPRTSLAAIVALGALATLASPALAGPSKYLAGDESLVKHYVALEGAKLGVSLPTVSLPGGKAPFIKITESPLAILPPTTEPDGTKSLPALADTDCRDAKGGQVGPAASCVIRIAKGTHNSELRGVIAHEVFHVFQFVMAGTVEHLNIPRKNWLVEGSATWAQSDLVPNDPGARGWWKIYLESPTVSLFTRQYSAIGFFGHMASSGTSPWGRFTAMFAAADDEEAYAAAAPSESFLDSEASSFFRESAFGSAWDEHGPNVPTRGEVGFTPPTVKIKASEVELRAAAHADDVHRIVLKLPKEKPVLEVRAMDPHVRLHSTGGGDVNEVDFRTLNLCSDPHGCSCPTQPSKALKQFQEGDLAITGGAGGGSVSLTPRKRCEVLLAGRSCENLVPNLPIPVHQLAEEVTHKSLAITSGDPNGIYSSVCLFPGGRGETVEVAPGETVLDGVFAITSYVKRYESIGQAEDNFALPPAFPGEASPPSFVTGIGDDAAIATTSEVNERGEIDYASEAVVRVRNLVAGFSLSSTGGNTEADRGSTLEVLQQVAAAL
jgi:hypothetical protein